MSKDHHYVPVHGGDSVLIDLGGYGVEIQLDTAGQFYDAQYVAIEYEQDGSMETEVIPSDVVVDTLNANDQPPNQGKGVLMRKSVNVRIYRHEKP